MIQVLKVKFCQTEDELNGFLKTLPVAVDSDNRVGRLHRITYLPKPEGKETDKSVEIGTSIVSIVEYWEFMRQQ